MGKSAMIISMPVRRLVLIDVDVIYVMPGGSRVLY